MQSVDLSEYNNSWYKPGKNPLIRVLWYFTNLIVVRNRYQPICYPKLVCLRLFGAKIGKRVVVKPGVNIKYPWKLSVGDNTWIGEGVWIDNLSMVMIGKNCCLSQGVMLLCGNHRYDRPQFDLEIKPIVLEDGVWIGAGTMVCPGCIAQTHAVVGAMSLAVGVIKPFSIYRGNPAVFIKQRIIRQAEI
jgi:putative colanic acid biosynthesis acetyltransferase WcaF